MRTKMSADTRPGHQQVNTVDGYNRWASTYDSKPNPLIMVEEDVTLELVGVVRDQRVLDLGCGTGRYCVLLAERGASVIGVDPSVKMLEHATRKTRGYPHVELYHGTIDAIDHVANQFDLVLSALALGHLPELEATLRKMSRLLKRGGRMVLSNIHPYWPLSGHNYAEFFDETGQEYRIPEYPHLLEDYCRLFKTLGMCLDDVREPRIEPWLLEHFPSLDPYAGMPLALILKASKLPCERGE